MLSFRLFLEQALDIKSGPGLANRGSDALRHLASYVAPYLNSGEDTHTIRTDYKIKVPGQKKNQLIFAKGQNVQLHAHGIDEEGNHHVIVSSNNGPKHRVPFNKIHRLSLASSWNDELATEHMWNYAVDHEKRGRNLSLHQHLSDMIDNARHDPAHPLSFENVQDKGFSGGKKQERHRASYFAELKDAAHAVDKMVEHPVLKDAFDSRWRAESSKWVASPAGMGRGSLSKLWLSHGVDPKSPAAISKSDIVIHPAGMPGHPQSIKISMKRGGGSQLISSGPEEFGALHQHAAEQHYGQHPEREKHISDIKDRVEDIKQIMNGARGAERSQVVSMAKQANAKYAELLEQHPYLNKYVRYEGATGNNKFDSPEHRASFLLTGSTKNMPAKIEALDHEWREKQQKNSTGAITVGKRPGASLAFRVRS